MKEEACGGFYRAAKKEPFMRILSDGERRTFHAVFIGCRSLHIEKGCEGEEKLVYCRSIRAGNGFFDDSGKQRIFWQFRESAALLVIQGINGSI